jgi:hypothetical protein
VRIFLSGRLSIIAAFVMVGILISASCAIMVERDVTSTGGVGFSGVSEEIFAPEVVPGYECYANIALHKKPRFSVKASTDNCQVDASANLHDHDSSSFLSEMAST